MNEVTVMTATLAWIPVVLTAIGTGLTGLGAWTAKQQVTLQRTLAEQSAQPYVWADVRGSERNTARLEVVVGNSGDTVATDVRVKFDPPLKVDCQVEDADGLTRAALVRLEKGLNSLAPGKVLHWHLGRAPDLLTEKGPQPHVVTVDARGPFGPLPTLEYVVDLSDFRETADQPSGSIHQLTEAVEGAIKEIGRSR